MKKARLTFLFIFSFFLLGRAQIDANEIISSSSPSIQYGFSIKLIYEIQRFTNFRVAIGGGVGKKIKGIDFFYPSFHSEVHIYNGGLGSPLKYNKQRFYIDFINALTVNFGLDYKSLRESDLRGKFAPLYYFADFSANPLQTPYFSSLALGTNYIISNDILKEPQVIGLFNLNVARTVQVTYYNDGGPVFHQLRLGDRFDRYYTGGLIISYHDDLRSDLDLVELSFHKFTGYVRYAFELASHLNINYISYKEPQAFYYNQNRYRINATSQKRGLGLTLSLYNVKGNWDIQNFLHNALNDAFHPSILIDDPLPGLGFYYNYAKFYSE